MYIGLYLSIIIIYYYSYTKPPETVGMPDSIEFDSHFGGGKQWERKKKTRYLSSGVKDENL
jgi:hypothetical protein